VIVVAMGDDGGRVVGVNDVLVRVTAVGDNEVVVVVVVEVVCGDGIMVVVLNSMMGVEDNAVVVVNRRASMMYDGYWQYS